MSLDCREQQLGIIPGSRQLSQAIQFLVASVTIDFGFVQTVYTIDEVM